MSKIKPDYHRALTNRSEEYNAKRQEKDVKSQNLATARRATRKVGGFSEIEGLDRPHLEAPLTSSNPPNHQFLRLRSPYHILGMATILAATPAAAAAEPPRRTGSQGLQPESNPGSLLAPFAPSYQVQEAADVQPHVISSARVPRSIKQQDIHLSNDELFKKNLFTEPYTREEEIILSKAFDHASVIFGSKFADDFSKKAAPLLISNGAIRGSNGLLYSDILTTSYIRLKAERYNIPEQDIKRLANEVLSNSGISTNFVFGTEEHAIASVVRSAIGKDYKRSELPELLEQFKKLLINWQENGSETQNPCVDAARRIAIAKDLSGIEAVSFVKAASKMLRTKYGDSGTSPNGDTDSFLTVAIRGRPDRPIMGEGILRATGFDPHQKYDVTRTHTGAMTLHEGALMRSKFQQSLLEIYMDSELFKAPYFQDNLDPEIKEAINSLPKLNELFDTVYGEYIESLTDIAQKEIVSKLYNFGVDGDAKADVLRVHKTMPNRLEHYTGNPRGSLGYIIRTGAGDQTKYFAITPAHGEMVTPLTEENYADWVKNNSKLFFSDDNQIHLRYKSNRPTYSTPIEEENSDLAGIIKKYTSDIIRDSLLKIKAEAYQETESEKNTNFMRSLIRVPFLNTYNEIKKGNYWLAIMNGVFDTVSIASDAGILKLGRLIELGQRTSRALHLTSRVAAKGSELMIKKMRKIPLSPSISNGIGELKLLIDRSPSIKSYIGSKETCEEVVKKLIPILRKEGYKTKIRSMNMWSNANDMLPRNHFVAVANKDGVDYVIDLTAPQFHFEKITSPIISTDPGWVKEFQDATKRTLIKYKDFDSLTEAKREFGLFASPFPTDVVNGANVIAPPWYEKAIAGG